MSVPVEAGYTHDDSLTVYVLDGTTAFQQDDLTRIATRLHMALECVERAEGALVRALQAIEMNAYRAPSTYHSAVHAVRALGAGPSAVPFLRYRVQRMRERVLFALALFTEGERTARWAVMTNYAMPALFRKHNPSRFDRRVLESVSAGALGITVAGGLPRLGERAVPTLAQSQALTRESARYLLPLVTERLKLRTSEGPAYTYRMGPVQALSAVLLRDTGLADYQAPLGVWRADDVIVINDPDRAVRPTAVRHVNGAHAVFEILRETAESASASGSGEIRIVEQRARDGSAAWTVLIPGTREVFAAKNPQDNLSNVQLMAHRTSDLTVAVKAAIENSPIQPGDTVTFVGHSQGGIASSVLAADAEINTSYHVGGVLTLGSPVGQVTGIPDDVPVLNLESADDFMPGLDGIGNPTGENQVTVVFDSDTPETAMEAHGIDHHANSYLQILDQGLADEVRRFDEAFGAAAGWDAPQKFAAVHAWQFERREPLKTLLDVQKVF